MKNYYNCIFATFVLFSTPLFSQGLLFEKGINDSYQQEILQIASKNEFTYALVKYDYFYVYLEKYDTLGNRLARVNLNQFGDVSSPDPNKMILTNDNNIWISGGPLFCDLPYIAQHVCVYDANCQRINSFVRSYSQFIGPNSASLGLTAITDTSVAVNFQSQDSSWIELLSPTTESILQNYQTPDLYGFGKNSAFYVLGHTFNKIYGIDNLGVFVDSILLPDTFREIGTWNDTIIALGYNQLFKIAPDLSSFTAHQIPNLSIFSRLKIDAQGVRFVSSNLNKGVHYLNHNLDVQSLTTVPVFSSNSITFDFDQHLAVASNFSLTNFSSIRLANYSLINPQNSVVNRSDIAVLGLQFTDYLVQNVSGGNVYQLDAKANVLIKNVGQNLVDSVRLNHYYGQNPSCGDDVTSVIFDSLNLASGDSVWVDFGWLGQYTNVVFGDSINRTYCVYSSNPNGVVDLNIANDAACKTAFFGILGQEELTKQNFKIYPNPAVSELTIKHTFLQEVHYSISNSLGQIFQQEGLKMSSIDVSNLSPGIYFISFLDHAGKLLNTQRFIKN